MGWAVESFAPAPVRTCLVYREMVISIWDPSNRHAVSRFKTNKGFVLRLVIELLNCIVSKPVFGLPSQVNRNRASIIIIITYGYIIVIKELFVALAGLRYRECFLELACPDGAVLLP